MPGDMVWTKANMFQGKRKMEYRWDEVEYEIVHARSQMVRPHMRQKI